METTVRKDSLLAKVRENRERHRGVFEAALDGYRLEALERLEAQVQDLSEGKTPKISIIITRPEDHTADYDRIITMLEMDVREELTIGERTFAQYVMDQWDWTRQWLRFSNRYASSATRQAYGEIVDEDYEL